MIKITCTTENCINKGIEIEVKYHTVICGGCSNVIREATPEETLLDEIAFNQN
jgi:hypothetical protein